MYYWKQYLSFSCPATSYSGVFTIGATHSWLRECLQSRCFVTTLLYCCAFEHAYQAIAWQRFGQYMTANWPGESVNSELEVQSWQLTAIT
jgi:hypothetical protein